MFKKYNNMKSKIYKLIDPTDNLIKYVGKTSDNLNKRLISHLHSAYNRNRMLNEKNIWLINLFELNKIPIIELIEEVDFDKSKEREFYWINYYNKINPLFNIIYNKNKELNIFYKKLKNKKIYQYDLNGFFIKEWFSIKEAADFYKISSSNIVRSAKKNESCNGFVWKYEFKENENIYKRKYFSKKIYQYDLNNNFIKEWNNARELIEFGFNYKNISQVCNGDKKSHKGYKFFFEKK